MATKDRPTKDDELKEREKRTMEERQELLKCLQNQVDEVDRNVTDLAKSFDSLYERMKEFETDAAPSDKDNAGEDKQILSKKQECLSHLLHDAKGVAEDKDKAIWSLSKLIHFIHADREDICNVTDQPLSLETCKELAIDRYLKRDSPSSDKNGETLIELLEEQNKRLQEKYKLARDHVKIVSEREKIVNDDRDLLRIQLDRMKQNMENGGFISSLKSGRETTIQVNDTTLGKGVYERESGTVCLSYSETELQKANHEISRLEADLKRTKDKLDDWSHVLVFDDVVEVALIHTRDTVHNSPENRLADLLTTAMTNSRVEYVLKVVRGTDIAKHDGISLICCEASSTRDWDDVFKNEQFKSIDYVSTIMLLFYDNTNARSCEEAQKRHFVFLDKFVSTLTIEHQSSGMIPNKEAYGKDIMDAIGRVKNDKRQVVGCIRCNNPSNSKKKSK